MATRTGFLPAPSVRQRSGRHRVADESRAVFQDVNRDNGLDDYVVVAIEPHRPSSLAGHGDGTVSRRRAGNHLSFSLVLGNLASPQDGRARRPGRTLRRSRRPSSRVEHQRVRWFRSQAQDRSRVRTTALALGEPGFARDGRPWVTVRDTNGQRIPGTVVLVPSPAGMLRLDLAGTTTGGMLTEITNGLGLRP